MCESRRALTSVLLFKMKYDSCTDVCQRKGEQETIWGDFSSPAEPDSLKGEEELQCLLSISLTLCGVSQRCNHVIAPPDTSVRSYHGVIEVSVCQLDPCCH